MAQARVESLLLYVLLVIALEFSTHPNGESAVATHRPLEVSFAGHRHLNVTLGDWRGRSMRCSIVGLPYWYLFPTGRFELIHINTITQEETVLVDLQRAMKYISPPGYKIELEFGGMRPVIPSFSIVIRKFTMKHDGILKCYAQTSGAHGAPVQEASDTKRINVNIAISSISLHVGDSGDSCNKTSFSPESDRAENEVEPTLDCALKVAAGVHQVTCVVDVTNPAVSELRIEYKGKELQLKEPISSTLVPGPYRRYRTQAIADIRVDGNEASGFLVCSAVDPILRVWRSYEMHRVTRTIRATI